VDFTFNVDQRSSKKWDFARDLDSKRSRPLDCRQATWRWCAPPRAVNDCGLWRSLSWWRDNPTKVGDDSLPTRRQGVLSMDFIVYQICTWLDLSHSFTIVYDVFFFAGGGLESLNLFKFHQFSILKQPLDHAILGMIRPFSEIPMVFCPNSAAFCGEF